MKGSEVTFEKIQQAAKRMKAEGHPLTPSELRFLFAAWSCSLDNRRISPAEVAGEKV